MAQDFVHVSARRWFDRVNGNTYHSVAVFRNGIHVGTIPFEYGYGRHYMHTAGRILGMADPYELDSSAFQQEVGVLVTDDVADVARRKDLHNRGR